MVKRIKQFFVPSSYNQRGDTIVEVLIALGVVSLVLTSAYALTRQNISASQQTQEQSIALKLIERQTELLLSAETAPTAQGCFGPDGEYVAAPSTSCVVNAAGDEYDPAQDTGAQYTLSIVQNSTTKTYTVNAQWVTLSGKTANASMYARRKD